MDESVNPAACPEPGSFGAALIRTLLELAPRPADGELTTVLIALHDMAEAWSTAARPEDESAIDDLVSPIYRLLEEYRPVSLAGVEALLDFTLRDMNRDRPPAGQRGYVAVLRDSVKALRRLEHERQARDGTALLRLDSPFVGRSSRPG